MDVVRERFAHLLEPARPRMRIDATARARHTLPTGPGERAGAAERQAGSPNAQRPSTPSSPRCQPPRRPSPQSCQRPAKGPSPQDGTPPSVTSHRPLVCDDGRGQWLSMIAAHLVGLKPGPRSQHAPLPENFVGEGLASPPRMHVSRAGRIEAATRTGGEGGQFIRVDELPARLPLPPRTGPCLTDLREPRP
jgi:hypothetical protein